MARIKDRKFDYKLNIFLGTIFLTGGIVYLKLSMSSGVRADTIKCIVSFILSGAWFALAFFNYKKSKNI
ncbi:MAG TPA: hypothetical protein VIO64_10255 [Pseudobacteroides sp.]|uniref:hypothetical protein n=1 Tax=Pseudobacteroides sp. TaxID=1968840 RepID=UPI002F932BB2